MTGPLVSDLRQKVASGGPSGARFFRAPGRVNLMGDHTDYHEGFVLPLAIELECVVASQPNSEGRVRVRSLGEAMAVDLAADGADEPTGVRPAWGRYVAGVVRALAERDRAPVGVDAVLASSVPAGSGLSSSAALEVALALTLCDAADLSSAPAMWLSLANGPSTSRRASRPGSWISSPPHRAARGMRS